MKERKKKDTPTEAAVDEAAKPIGGAPAHPIRAIRRAGVPLVFIETSDPAATIKGCIAGLNGKNEQVVIAEHDVLRGLKGLNKPGIEWANKVSPSPTDTSNPAEFLDRIASQTPEGAMVFFHQANRYLTNEAVIQGIWNLRDSYKGIQATLIMLGPSVDLPAELKNDVVVVEEPVPNTEDIQTVVTTLSKESGVPIPELLLPKVIDALLGHLSLFGVEQDSAMCITKDGWDMDVLWALKVKALKTVAGLEIMMPKETFANLAGCEGIKSFIAAYLGGKEPPRAVLLFDEVNDMVAGGDSDLSGTTQAIREQFLYWTEARKVKGILKIGVPGAGKTQTARAIAGEAKVPLLRASMSTVKGSLVGQSEQNMKNLLKAIDAVAQGRLLMIGTCNSVDNMAPQMMGRFKLAKFVYDYPNRVEATALWRYFMGRYKLEGDIPEGVDNWVGREIESACERAWMFNIPLHESIKSEVPICIANKDKMETLRQKLSGRFLSAAQPGIYYYTPTAPGQPSRKLSV